MLVGGRKRAIFLDNVRMSGDHLIGGDHQGWQVLGTHLEFEHGGGGRAFPRDETLDDLLSFVKNARNDEGPLGRDPVLQQKTMDAVHRVPRTGPAGQAHSLDVPGEGGDQVRGQHGQRSRQRVRAAQRHASTGHNGPVHLPRRRGSPALPFGGAQEVRQRGAAGQRHAGGSTNIAKVVLARRIGISRTQERPAPTPSTTGTG